MKAFVAGSLAVCICFSTTLAQEKSDATTPAEAIKDGRWEQIDQRLVFLMVRLANVEASLDAINAAIAKSTGKRASKLGSARRAEAGNELMDRKAGGPMKWSEFYGTTAEKFFYHPVDENTTYQTATVLNQRGSEAENKVGGGVPASQGVPIHQRPPQFDYIYRANRDAQAKAGREAAELRNKIDELTARRTALESEQSELWCEVAFRAVSRYDLARKPLYRFEPLAALAETLDQERAGAIKAAALFMRAALLIVAEAQKDQAKAFGNIKIVVTDARDKLNDGWIRQTFLAGDMSDLKTPAGKFMALAKRLDDVSSNLSDSYEVSIEGDRSKDEQRKETFRALLQQSLVSYAQLVLALDEMSALMAREWKIKPDLDRPYQTTELLSVTTLGPSTIGTPATGDARPAQPVTTESAVLSLERGGVSWSGNGRTVIGPAAGPTIRDLKYVIFPVATGLGAASAMVIDDKGSLFVLDYQDAGTGRIHWIKPNGLRSEIPTGLLHQDGIALLSDGNFLIATDQLYRVERTGHASMFKGDLSYPGYMRTLAVGGKKGSSPVLFLVENGAGRILTMKPDGAFDVFASGLNNPSSFTVDDNGHFWVTEHSKGDIVEIGPDGAVLNRITGFGADGLAGIEFWEGNLFVGNPRDAALYRVSRDGKIEVFATGFAGKTSPPSLGPSALLVGHDGLYVGDGAMLWIVKNRRKR